MANFIQTRGMLAKLLATENLIIEHDASATTAAFDTENRVLRLPVLNTEDENVYNMFCAHEVGHALQTPQLWKDDVPDNVPFDFVNVVEDVRIEKYIQSKFPGLRVDFSKGYDKLNDQDFFQLNDKDISEMSLIDRINLHFKLGARALINFTPEELVYVDAVDDADTWQKVLLVAKMIHDYIGGQQQKDDDLEPQSGDESGDSESEGEGEQTSQFNSSEESKDGDDEGDQDDQSDVTSQSNPEVSETQQAFDEALSRMTKDTSFGDKYVYVNVGDIKLDDIVTSIDQVRDTIIPCDRPEYAAIERDNLNNFLKSIKADVNHMVQQFEMKKSADAYARQQTHKTGVLDTNRLHNYKISDDIFLRQSITPDGKCHGMVMYLDWSGSMCDVCHDTIKQIITLVQFCRKVQIPFDVYLFTTGDEYRSKFDQLDLNKTLAHHTANVIQVLTSNGKKKQIEDDIFHLWCASMCLSRTVYDGHLPWSPHYQMGGTPLNNALMIVPELIKQFRAKTGAQKISFVCITDGESAPLCYWEKRNGYDRGEYVRVTYPYYEKMMVRDGLNVYPVDANQTGDCVNWIKSQVSDVAISNIFLGKLAKSNSHLRSYGSKIDEKVFRKSGSFVTTTNSWPIIGVINPTTFTDTTDEIDIEAGAGKAKIKSALNRMLKTKQSSRMILTELVGQWA